MFGLFKKKSKPTDTAKIFSSPKKQQLLKYVVNLLELQLSLCMADEQKFSRLIESNFGRGYFLGFIDSAFTTIGHQANTQAEMMALAVSLYSSIFKVDMDASLNYAEKTLVLYSSDNTAFDRGLNTGGQEYLDFQAGKIEVLLGLSSYFHNEMP